MDNKCQARAIKPTHHNRPTHDIENDPILCDLPAGHLPTNDHKPAKSRKQRGFQCTCTPHRPGTQCTTWIAANPKRPPIQPRPWKGLIWKNKQGVVVRRV